MVLPASDSSPSLLLWTKMLYCTKSRLQCLSGSSVVWGELLGTFLSSYLFLDNHLIALGFCRSTAHRKTEVTNVGLCYGVRIIGGKLVGRVAHGNWQIQCRSLKVQSKITWYVVGFVDLYTWREDQRWCWTWSTWRVLSLSSRWSSSQKISLKVEICLHDFLLNDLERIWWNNSVCSIRHEGSHWCCRYGQYVQQHWTKDMTKS